MDKNQYPDEIRELISRYFEGLYLADSQILEGVFHLDARYINTVSGEYLNLSKAEYLKIIEQRTSPSELNQERKEQIISVEFNGQNMAFIKLTMQMLERQYLDFLSLIFADNRWQIISKVFSYHPLKGM